MGIPANDGMFVLSVAMARAEALSGGTGTVSDGDDTVAVTQQGTKWVVESTGLFSDGLLQERVERLLLRHG